jgi:hypothetical protein
MAERAIAVGAGLVECFRLAGRVPEAEVRKMWDRAKAARAAVAGAEARQVDSP